MFVPIVIDNYVRNSEDHYQMPCSVIFDLGLHGFPRSHKMDSRLILKGNRLYSLNIML